MAVQTLNSLAEVEEVLARAQAEAWTTLALVPSAYGSWARRLVKAGWAEDRVFDLAFRLDRVPRRLLDLRNLTALSLGGNYIGEPGAETLARATHLANLTTLHLEFNKIGEQGAEALANATHLANLTTLYLGFNNIGDRGAAALAGATHLANLTWLHLLGNNISGLPAELLASWDAQAIFEAIRTGLPLNEAKLVLLGMGEAGKTNIARRLRAQGLSKEERDELRRAGDDLGFNEQHVETWDFDIANWPVRLRREADKRDRDVRIRVLDFAGQTITYAVHQFFLTQRCVYLLVVDGTRDVRANDVDDWLRRIFHFAGASPVLIAVNKADEAEKQAINLTELRDITTEIAELYNAARPLIIPGVSAKRDAKLPELKKAILERVREMPTLDERVPRAFRDLRAWYEDPDNFDTYEDINRYEQRCCDEFGIDDQQRQRTYLRMMHEFASVFHWDDDLDADDETRQGDEGGPWRTGAQPRVDPSLAHRVFHPHWLKQRVFDIIRNNERIEAQSARFDLERARRILKHAGRGPADERTELHQTRLILSTMECFELCFKFEDGRHWLLPARLGENPIPTPGWSPSKRLVGRFRYLHESVIHRLIVRLHGVGMLCEGIAYWRYGCLAQDRAGQAHARIAMRRDDRTITIEAVGDTGAASELVNHIRYTIEDIHMRGAGVRPDEAIAWQPQTLTTPMAAQAQPENAPIPPDEISNKKARNSVWALLWGLASIGGFAKMSWERRHEALTSKTLEKPSDCTKFDLAALPDKWDTFRSHCTSNGYKDETIPSLHSDAEHWFPPHGTRDDVAGPPDDDS